MSVPLLLPLFLFRPLVENFFPFGEKEKKDTYKSRSTNRLLIYKGTDYTNYIILFLFISASLALIVDKWNRSKEDDIVYVENVGYLYNYNKIIRKVPTVAHSHVVFGINYRHGINYLSPVPPPIYSMLANFKIHVDKAYTELAKIALDWKNANMTEFRFLQRIKDIEEKYEIELPMIPEGIELYRNDLNGVMDDSNTNFFSCSVLSTSFANNITKPRHHIYIVGNTTKYMPIYLFLIGERKYVNVNMYAVEDDRREFEICLLNPILHRLDGKRKMNILPIYDTVDKLLPVFHAVDKINSKIKRNPKYPITTLKYSNVPFSHWVSARVQKNNVPYAICKPRILKVDPPDLDWGDFAEDCSICLQPLNEEIVDGDFTAPCAQVIKLPCRGGHKFHKSCISKYWKANFTQECPLCRDNLTIRAKSYHDDIIKRVGFSSL